MVFQQSLLKKACFIAKISGLAMVRPASSDFWKAPLEKPTGHRQVKISFYHLNYLIYMTPYTLEAAMQILSVYDSYT